MRVQILSIKYVLIKYVYMYAEDWSIHCLFSPRNSQEILTPFMLCSSSAMPVTLILLRIFSLFLHSHNGYDLDVFTVLHAMEACNEN